MIDLQTGDALILVDIQHDFLPGGALAVAGGNQVIGSANGCITRFTAHGFPVVATRDWHPANHCSFKPRGPWPPHCVVGTHGAAFADDLNLPDDVIIVSKADKRDVDAYSGFQETILHARLQALGIRRLFVGGLATDYCVLNTVTDALNLGYRVMLLTDAIRAVNLRPGDGECAVANMISAGADAIRSEQIAC